MILHIKNMVCDRCIMVVKQQLENLRFSTEAVALGSAIIHPDPDAEQLTAIASALKVSGFEMIDNEKQRIVERIKNLVIEKVHYTDMADMHINYSEYLSNNLNKDYSALSRTFSESEDITIEKVKELLEYGELNMNEIAWKMGYSSSAHLSAQFKTITGTTPTRFKTSEPGKRNPIDKI